MTTDNNELMVVLDDDVHAQASRMAMALRALKPKTQHRKEQLFALLRPVIMEMLGKNVTQKAILEMLEENGLKLHPARFKELMAVELSTKESLQ